jgi:hypothetical protein
MSKIISGHNISIEIFNKKPNIKHSVIHSDDGDIIVTPKKKSEWKNHNIFQGRFIFGSYKYIDLIHCDFWPLEKYENQWIEGIKRLDKHDTSCLITRRDKPRNIEILEWWILYKIKNMIHAQFNSFLGSQFIDLINEKPFTIETCYDFIPPRQKYDKYGHKIKEYLISFIQK